jgi:hypothetical protein
VFDTDGNPFFEIEVSNFATGPIYIDDSFCEEMTFIAGRWAKIVSGVTAAIKGDKFTQACTLDYGVGSVELTGGAGGQITSITVDHADYGAVSLLTAAIPYNTSLAQTAQDAVDNINAHKTFPGFVASRSGNTIVITQETPIEGTFTVTTVIVTMTKTDTDITGASLGEIQDALVRRTGFYLPHAGSASTGWGDHA